jgi:integrase
MEDCTKKGINYGFIQYRKKSKKNGSVGYQCVVVIKSKSSVVYRESRTFAKLNLAKTWGANRKSDLDVSGVPIAKKMVTIQTLIIKYLNDPYLGGKAGRTMLSVLNMLADCDMAKHNADELKQSDIIEHCKNRNATGTSPATIYHDIAYLKSVLRAAKPVFNIDINEAIVSETIPMLVKMKLIGRSKRRSRRPSDTELIALEKQLNETEKHPSCKIPYVDMLNFSILSCMRIGEVCNLRWEDLDENKRAILVRERKDPLKKEDNHMMVALLGKAFPIVMRQKKVDGRIFPYNSKSVTSGFQRVRAKIKIKDLRYQDLRREGASRLFEDGYSIEQVAQVTGHRNFNTLWQVYTELYPENLHRD